MQDSNKTILSFVIPLYNAEKYIADCINSILQSSLQKEAYEIIVVNDVSQDNGPHIVKEFCKEHSNIHLLSQKNQGLSVARNYGLKESKGEYVWYIDSDDKLDPDTLPSTFDALINNRDCDVIAIQEQKISENGELKGLSANQTTLPLFTPMSGRDAVVSGYYPCSACALICKKTFLINNDLFFKPGITHQDVELTYRLMPIANKVIFTDLVPYIYILHPNSTSQSINPSKKIKYLCDETYIIESFFKTASKYKESDSVLSDVIEQRGKNVLLGLTIQLWRNKKVWGKEVNQAVILCLKSNRLYPNKMKYERFVKNAIKVLLNFEFLLK